MLQTLAHKPLILIIDRSAVGCQHKALMLSVVYGYRALPLAWMVRRGDKGHFPQEMHRALLAQIIPLVPEGATVYVLGNGEFEGIKMYGPLTIIGTWEGNITNPLT